VSETLEKVFELVGRKQVMISSHGYDELAAGGIPVRDIVSGIAKAVVVEDYPKGAIHFAQVAMPFVFLVPTLLRGNPDLKCSTVCCADFATLKTVEGAGAPKK